MVNFFSSDLYTQDNTPAIPPAVNEEYADLIIEYRGSVEPSVPSGSGSIIPIDDRFAVLYVPLSLLSLSGLTAPVYSAIPKCYTYMDTESLNASGISRLQNHPYLNLSGRGTAIAVIDSGIDYTLPEFQNSDGSTRIAFLWDQQSTSGIPPAGFGYGAEYTSADINRALESDSPLETVPSSDDNGHGTFLAGIAAGGERQNENFLGAAPGATLIVVRLKPAKKYLRELFVIPPDADVYQENDIMLAVRYALECALKLNNLPLSICIGLGSSSGSHFGTSPLAQYLNNVGRAFRTFVCIAAGNEGNSRHHYMGLNTPGTGADVAELRVAANEPGFTLELWGTALNPYRITLQSPSGESAEIIPSRFNSAQTVRFIFTGSVIYITAFPLEGQSGNQAVVFRFLSPEPGIWRFLVETQNITPLTYNMWLPVGNLIQEETYFLRSTPNETITGPGDSEAPLTVSAYDYRNNSLYLEASRGFTPSQLIKPELTAPGVDLIGPLPGGRFTTRSGTSLAAAHTAGAASLFMEWAVIQGNTPSINGLAVKNALIRSARRNPDLTYPNREWGYGILDLYNTFSSLF